MTAWDTKAERRVKAERVGRVPKAKKKTEDSPATARLKALQPPKSRRGLRSTGAVAGLRRAGTRPPNRPNGVKVSPPKKKVPVSPMTRRNRIPVALAALFAVAVLATSFPLSGLISQRQQLSAAATQLKSVQHANQLLAEQESQLNSNVEIERLARQDYQLVAPGQTLYDVLPPAGQTTSLTPGASTSGDPGTKPLVDPADAPDMSPDPGLAKPLAPVATAPTAPSGGAASSPSAPVVPSTFWGRVSNTLEFWK